MDYKLKEPICKLGVWDSTVPGISFDEDGISNYAKVQLKLMKDFSRGEKGKRDWEKIVSAMKKAGKNKKYDCIMGVSGGTDSSYLLHLSKEYNLRVLAINIDNGFNSDIAVKNIKKVTSKLDIDFFTYVIEYEEIKDILKTYMKASLPWIDSPSDLAIKSTLFKIAHKKGISYILSGTDFRSEGMQPNEWTYSDVKQLKYLQKKYGSAVFDSYPYLNLVQLLYLSRTKGIKRILPFNYIDYQKKKAQAFLNNEYGWDYYGGHHHENAFTKFTIGYWLPYKFGIDKRKITLSAQILSGEITKETALKQLERPAIEKDEAENLKQYIIKKLDIGIEEFNKIWESPNKFYYDYPNNYEILVKYKNIAEKLLNKAYTSRPKSFYQIDMRS
ncbi:MAG: N-acetyl sugar amidotransferase [Ignavibacteria bacterium]|jgi:N-acetyl sugar amidotransferase